jgi:hypothetical protein
LKEGDSMAMTLAQAKVQAIQHINEYSVNGTLVSTSNGNYQDLIKRMNPLANTAQLELCKIAKIPDTQSVDHNVIPNLLGLQNANEKEKQHYPGTNDSYTAAGADSFSIEVSKPCTITFEEYESGAWINIVGTYIVPGGTATAFTGNITVTGITTFTNYKGTLTLTTSTNDVRMTITTLYPMKSRYRAMYGYPFENAASVPRYAAYVPYDLPSNYMEFNKIMRSYDERQFGENSDFILTPDNKVHINWNLSGQFDIHYWKFPTEITNDTLDTYEFEVRLDAQAAIPWYMGAYAIMPDNPSLGVQLLNQYYVLKDELTETDDLEITTLQGTWG